MATAAVQAKSRAIIRRNRRTAYLFLAPNFIGFLIFTLIPVLFAVVLSFNRWDGNNPMQFVGFRNFTRLFSDSNFRISLINTVIYTVGTVPLIMVIALGLSMLINSGVRGAPVYRALHFFPHISSIIAISAVWQFLYHPTMGPINKFLMALGISNPPGWLSSTRWALIAVMIMIVWKSVGYYMISYLAGLQAIPRELYEAATIDGANKWKRFLHVTLPGLKPINFYVAIICIINSFQVFTPIYVMTRGGPGRATRVLVYTIYQEAFEEFNFGYASAMSMVLFLCIFIVTVIQFKTQNQGE
ncbi:carbohydrate ABC transporter permease [Breznakiella homolactica]|uniref:Sugar ABC transporter permease n=1 Tax=Breznakiella homolactica TaxID=2798577 RepID=A0A7T7XJX0_9SPIR|nr:sugar ABC transporter permease [Breznakiella homolactica]QQO07736.1 sugar ABC transporter permease [Breznakiella homolactica]